MSTVVYVLSFEPNTSIGAFFQSAGFPVVHKNIPLATSSKSDALSTRVLACLEDSRKKYQSKNVLITKDTTVSAKTPAEISVLINKAIKAKDWDLIYLSKWLDRCDLYNPTKFDRYGTGITRIMSPHGFQSIVFSPTGRDRVLGYKPLVKGGSFLPLTMTIESQLNAAIQQGSLVAIGFTIDPMKYDISKATCVKDIAKLSMCRKPDIAVNASPLSFYWFVLILAITVLAAYSLYILSPRTTERKKGRTTKKKRR